MNDMYSQIHANMISPGHTKGSRIRVSGGGGSRDKDIRLLVNASGQPHNTVRVPGMYVIDWLELQQKHLWLLRLTDHHLVDGACVSFYIHYSTVTAFFLLD